MPDELEVRGVARASADAAADEHRVEVEQHVLLLVGEVGARRVLHVDGHRDQVDCLLIANGLARFEEELDGVLGVVGYGRTQHDARKDGRVVVEHARRGLHLVVGVLVHRFDDEPDARAQRGDEQQQPQRLENSQLRADDVRHAVHFEQHRLAAQYRQPRLRLDAHRFSLFDFVFFSSFSFFRIGSSYFCKSFL